jgi:hypothetical protein
MAVIAFVFFLMLISTFIAAAVFDLPPTFPPWNRGRYDLGK